MSARQRRGVLSALVILAVPILSILTPASEDTTITLGTNPEPPDCIPPRATIAFFWEVEYSTAPEFVYYCLMDPDLVCDTTPVEESIWSLIKSDFRR